MIDLTDNSSTARTAGLETKGMIFDIKKYAVHDGPGIRTTIFFKGCPLNCWWCHNPEGQKKEPEAFFNKSTGREEVIGREVSVVEVMAEIEKDLIFYDESGGGVTFSGGEPLMQLDFLNQLLSACKEQEITTALDTCGYAPWNAFEKIKDKVDLFLYDIKILDNEKHMKYTGVSSEPVLSNLKKLDREGKNIIIRFPVIPNITDTETNIDQLVAFLNTLETAREINLLPYHKIGKGKFEKLNRIYELSDLESPSADRLEQLLKRFNDTGFKVKIGG